MTEFVVYRITNARNGRFYVGSSIKFLNRRAQHLRSLADGSCPTYLIRRDVERNSFQPEDFSIEVMRKLRTRERMLCWEQRFLQLHWGTRNCYNAAFEVEVGRVRRTFVAWNMQSLEVRQYLSWQAAARDLSVTKLAAKRAIATDMPCQDGWMVELFSKRRTITEVRALYERIGLELPLIGKSQGSRHALLSGAWNSLSDIVYRKRAYANIQTPPYKRLVLGFNAHQGA